ncbi:MAG: TonB-dependent receptor plug domain-containing protein, partial [Kordiimonas sp.]
MSQKDLMSKLLMGTVAYGAISAVALPAVAQDAAADTDDNGFEEIYVTARKKQELVTEVPMNIATVGAVEIAKRNLVNKEDFFRSIAGAAAPGIGDGMNRGQLILRGLVGANDATPNTTSTFTDGIPFNFGDLYDVERVEVLRGPQGTLYGSNAIGGTVRVITNKPNLDETEIGASVLFKHEHNRPGIETRGYGYVNMPIVEGQLALRVTGSSGTKSGKIRNVRDNHIGSEDERFLRAQLLWSPEESTRINLGFVHHRFYRDDHQEVDVQTPSSYYNAILTANADAPYGYDVAFDFPECPSGADRPTCLSMGNTTGDAHPEFSVWQLMNGNNFRQTNVFQLNVEKDNIIDGVAFVYAGSIQDHDRGGLQTGWSQLDANAMFRTWIIDTDGSSRSTHEMRLQSAAVESPL